MIEYVALGDFATAVGFLLASTPEKSARYYRDALCTLALAVGSCIPSWPCCCHCLLLPLPAVVTTCLVLVHGHCLYVQSLKTLSFAWPTADSTAVALPARARDSPGQCSVTQHCCIASLQQHSLLEDCHACHAHVPKQFLVPNMNKLYFLHSISIRLQPANWTCT